VEWLHTDGRFDLDTSARGHGKRRPRPKGMLTPCWKCPKIPRDAPARERRYAEELSLRNQQALRHYRECAAVGSFPDDPIVRRNAALIREVIEAVALNRMDALITSLAMLRVTTHAR
jgi:hypothetical protein